MLTAQSNRILSHTANAVSVRVAARALAACAQGYNNLSSSSYGSSAFDLKKKKFLIHEYPIKTARLPQHQKFRYQSTYTEGRNAYNVSKIIKGPNASSEAGIDAVGITNPATIYRNLTFQELYDHEVENKEGSIANAEYGDTFTVDTGKFTGRSPNDKFMVKYPGSESDKNLDWGKVNQPTTPEVYKTLFDRAVAHFNTLDKAYVFDGFCGANPRTQKKIRFIHEISWQQHFVTNMFIRPESHEQLEGFEPDFTIINACSQVVEDWKELGLHSDTAVVFDVEQKTAVIFGTWYGGENKKGIFSLMHYWLPMHDPPQLPMHCSANVGQDGDSALFFGLSGTGKTTLSADPHRYLIGDDEHGWDEEGVYNFEGGCYAKTINLTEETEPDIYKAIKTDALLENVALKEEGEKLIPDYFDVSKTENGRVSYPIYHIDNFHKPQTAGHPRNILFLTCDAFGVLPPVSKLSSGQAMYHFLSGYTAKVAGTERGIKEPQATFSACFGAAFLTLHPTRYADLLQEKLDTHGSSAYLVNTGWTGGAYGVGQRMSINATRSCVDAILDGSIHSSEFEKDEIFGFEIPKTLPNVDSHLLNPKNAWEDHESYEETVEKLATMYIKNFEKYEGKGSVDYTQFGPKL
eukprot:CAMPEP_0195522378 /NCGR_PEP_ID=MMETSP0794_2-20130614/20511_1 /TAXON_ID=515487 /ORGANISM="Stephanopyxis turris, Strain CCMP 815" /LENGTH=632 /DNA_ID=CAMNT_0040652127 /DNA_START=41 /DNA_END=1939 /DNA_ORIENTATION=-